MHNPLAAVIASMSVLSAGTVVYAQEAPPAPEVVIEGRGFGHGVGLAQDGALAMASSGSTASEILATFYPGTSIGRRSGTVRVDLLERPVSSAVIEFPSGGEVVDDLGGPAPGFPIAVEPGGRVRLSFDGAHYYATPLEGASAALVAVAAPTPPPPPTAPAPTTTTTIPSLLGLIPLPPPTTAPPPTPPTTAPPPPEPEAPAEPMSTRALRAVPNEDGAIGIADLGRRYRGTIQAQAAGAGLQLVNELDVELYLRGMGEVLDPGWPQAGLQVQAIAARTYALDAMANGRPLCTSQQCQVYLGETVEYAAMNRAVADTRSQVLTYRGSLAEAVYSANGGGTTATPEEGFGVSLGEYPYLVANPYPTQNPDPWEVRLPLSELAARLGYPGEAAGVAVSRRGPSGRVLEVTVTGDAGPHPVDGQRVWDQLGLRSNFFTLRIGGPEAVAGRERTAASGARRPARQVFAAGPSDVTPLRRAALTVLAVLLIVGTALGTRAIAGTGNTARARGKSA